MHTVDQNMPKIELRERSERSETFFERTEKIEDTSEAKKTRMRALFALNKIEMNRLNLLQTPYKQKKYMIFFSKFQTTVFFI